MKLFIKSILISLSVIAFFTHATQQVQEDTNATEKQKSLSLPQSANDLFLEGSRIADIALIRQAKEAYSLWLAEKEHTADSNSIVQVLRSRAAASIALGDINDAIADYKASNQLSPSGEIQLGICFLEKKQNSKSDDRKACYQDVVQFFAQKHVVKTDINYLLARILSGDKTAIPEYKNLIQTEQDAERQEIYKMVARSYLDKADCQQLVTLCQNK